jgi:hypothetical protein
MLSCARNQISAFQHLATAVFVGEWKKGYMAAATCYCDVGGTRSEIAISPAIVVATPDQWMAFDRRWSECLKVFGVSSLHMKHFAHSRGEFESWKGHESKRRRFLNHLLWIMEDTLSLTSAIAVKVPGYNAANRKYKLAERVKPYTLGCIGCAGQVSIWSREANINWNQIVWVFEKGDQDQNDLRKNWNTMYPDSSVDPIFRSKREKVSDTEFRYVHPFEAADFIAYEHLLAHRLIDRMNSDVAFAQLRKSMQRMRCLPGANRWGYYYQAEIESLCRRWRLEERTTDPA